MSLFPKLRYIHLIGTDFFVTSSRKISIDMLLDYLMERCERNAEVQTLSLDDCNHISSDDIERLREIVVDVIWDGVEGMADDDSSVMSTEPNERNIIDDLGL